MAPLTNDDVSGMRFAVTYGLHVAETEARDLAAHIANEQTVESAEAILPAGPIRDHLLGRVEEVRRLAPDRHEAIVSYSVDLLESTCARLLNVLFGMSSLRAGVCVMHVEWPEAVLARWAGPGFGRDGLRALVGAPDRPLVCGVLKPIGRTPAELADLARQFALGGIDLVKDDQGLGDHAFCSFEERVLRCADAVARASKEIGKPCLYLPHVTGPGETLKARARRAKQAGAGGLLVCPGLVGFDAIGDLAQDDSVGLPIMAHPALLGALTADEGSGMAPALMFGQLPRLAGADACLFPAFDTGYRMTRDDCRAVAHAAGRTWGDLKPMLPAVGGRIDASRVAELAHVFGHDLIMILGSAMQREPHGIAPACRAFMRTVTESAARART